MADSPGTNSRFNVIPVKQASIRFKEGSPEEYAAVNHPPEQAEDDHVSTYSQDIDDIGYITCERYDRPRRGVDYDSDDGEGFNGEDTFEAMPRETNYVLSLTREGRARPTILELREDKTDIARVESGISRKDSAAVLIAPVTQTAQGIKFGWIRGVFVRCLLNIWGVLLFMRLSWVVAQAGLGLTVAILALAAVVVVTTTLSMSAISTNGAVKGGGTYFLISRSLGPEFGGAVGIIFSLANAVAVGMNCVGFAEALVELLAEHGVMMVDFTNDVRIVGLITMIGLLALILSPNALKWEGRTQLVLFGVIIGSFINFFVGTFLPRSEQKLSKGIVEYSATTFSDNFWPNFRDGHSFMTMFGIFFPACTGIMAGANISGDLKNPGTAIPKGTLLAIFVSIMSYLLCALAIAATGIRDATGSVLDLISGNITDCPLVCIANGTMDCTPSCRWGISNSYQMMTEMSAVGPIITTGVFAASLSSALACLVSAPKLFQALCRDNLFPYIGVFGKGYGKTDEPRLAYVLAFFIGCAVVAIADLNAIALIISNFYIGTYVLINYACFDASLSASPGFRPAFRFFNQWVSLLGALLCVTCMFMINWLGALLTMTLIVFLYLYMHFKAPDVNWGSSIQARAFKSTVQQALKLMTVEDHVKNFRPQVLLLSGLPSSRPALVYFVNTFTKSHGLMICGQVLAGEENLHAVHKLNKPVYAWFKEKKLKCFHSAVAAPNFRQGVRALLQVRLEL
ncbi:hypothetical protein RvY_01129-2 [Ramazzottius varieornatus]|uniref:Amino acid permease/ SLC12A domain-containing protein n=1 Tax=Ramazzottius varieornatus TaxID=947166 RepID=A0A1D1UJ66_RAMVA|nr:hypothetical protein RvY_01129-2 [Ramazzottius varieornatus]